jgi:hypothetical protein
MLTFAKADCRICVSVHPPDRVHAARRTQKRRQESRYFFVRSRRPTLRSNRKPNRNY